MSSSLLQKILDDIKVAMKSHDSVKLETLRTLHSDIKNISINSGKEISDEIVIDVLAKSIKQKNEAMEMFRAGGRSELIAAEETAVGLFKHYLPAELSEAEVVAMILEIKAAVGATSPKDMGKIMKEINPRIRGRFDGKRISELVQEALR
jgi:hypothetical protein